MITKNSSTNHHHGFIIFVFIHVCVWVLFFCIYFQTKKNQSCSLKNLILIISIHNSIRMIHSLSAFFVLFCFMFMILLDYFIGFYINLFFHHHHHHKNHIPNHDSDLGYLIFLVVLFCSVLFPIAIIVCVYK